MDNWIGRPARENLPLNTKIMSSKREIIVDMYDLILPHLRSHSRSSMGIWYKLRCLFDYHYYYEIELIHSLHICLLSDSFERHDIWVMNNQMKWYVDEAAGAKSPLYALLVPTIRRLFDQAPPNVHSQLNWPGPRQPAIAEGGGL